MSKMIKRPRKFGFPRATSNGKSSASRKLAEDHYDPQDPLNSIREFRLRKVASKRIPSRIT